MKRGLVCLLMVALPLGGAHAAERPNIVMFVLDDMNDWVHSLGYRQAITPNMDRMRKHAPTVFAKPGPEVGALKLLVDGDAFRWEGKKKEKAKRK